MHNEATKELCVSKVKIKFKVKAPISDTPKHADIRLRANPVEYQREPRPAVEGVTTAERQVRKQAGEFKGEM